MFGKYLSERKVLFSLLVVLLLGCSGIDGPRSVDLYERGDSHTTRPDYENTGLPTRISVERRISNVSVNAYYLSNRLRQTRTPNISARQRKSEIEARLKRVDFEIIQLTQKPTIPEDKVLEYAQRVGRLEQELGLLSQMLETL